MEAVINEIKKNACANTRCGTLVLHVNNDGICESQFNMSKCSRHNHWDK